MRKKIFALIFVLSLVIIFLKLGNSNSEEIIPAYQIDSILENTSQIKNQETSAWPNPEEENESEKDESEEEKVSEKKLEETNSQVEELTKDKEPVNSKLVNQVPFVSQAPFGDWQDPRQQDGCEEASALMAVKWARSQDLTPEIALQEIINISNFLEKNYQEFRDSSLEDVINGIFKDYFDYHKVEIKKDVDLEDLIYYLNQGNIILAPMNGQKLFNPYYTPPGPERHMLVIIGFNLEKNVFITNDPGTRMGKSYKYQTEAFYQAIQAYPTGYKEPIEIIEKNVILVWQ